MGMRDEELKELKKFKGHCTKVPFTTIYIYIWFYIGKDRLIKFCELKFMFK